MRIAVVGARGQLASAIVDECAAAGHEVSAFAHEDLDIRDEAAARQAFATVRADVVVNGAAYNDVDGAEAHAFEALSLNALAVGALARSAAAVSARFVHFSTDFVFDGAAAVPYTEDDRPSPGSVYAASKLLGEQSAMAESRAYVLRVASLFGHGQAGRDKGTIAGLVRTIAAGGTASVFGDRTTSPTFVPDAARATRLLVERGAPAGVYHCVNAGCTSWADLAREIARQMNLPARLNVVSMADVKTRAARPRFSALSPARLALAGASMPDWQDAIRRYLAEVVSVSSRAVPAGRHAPATSR